MVETINLPVAACCCCCRFTVRLSAKLQRCVFVRWPDDVI